MNEKEMANYLIDKVKMARSSLSYSLKEDLIKSGQNVSRQLIKLLPDLNSYVVTSDVLEILGQIGGNDAFKALSTLLEDAQPGNLPKRLISQSCIRGLTAIGNQQSVDTLINALNFFDQELKCTAIDALNKLSSTKPEYKPQIISAFINAHQKETFEKPGKLLEDSLEKLGQPIARKQTWTNVPNKPLVIQPIQFDQPPPPVIRPVQNVQTPRAVTQPNQSDSFTSINFQNQPVKVTGPNKYSFLTEDEQKQVLDTLLTCQDEKEKLNIIHELGESGNIQVIDELLTVAKSSGERNVKLAAVDAILKIAPNDQKLRFLVLEYILDKRVIGQTEAKEALANALRIAQIGLKRSSTSTKPIGSYLFVGPTGVGKTELAKALAEALYGNELQLIRLDMSEYTDLSDKNKLIGSPPGYAGCDEGGRLTQEVLKKPQSVILFDEIEKAHAEIFNLFLQLLDDGRLTDSKGVTVSFKDTIILMTSNVGSQDILDGIKANLTMDEIKLLVKDATRTKFKPEFLNRINEIIIFRPLTADELLQVLNLKLSPTAKNLYDKYQLTLEVTDNAKNHIIQATQKQEFGFSPRELNRIIDNEIVQPLSEKLLDLEIAESYQGKIVIPRGGKVMVDYADNKLFLNIEKL